MKLANNNIENIYKVNHEINHIKDYIIYKKIIDNAYISVLLNSSVSFIEYFSSGIAKNR